MKNFLDNVASGDGKYIRIDDIIALQAGWQAFEKTFANLNEPFVISGCVVSGTAPNNAVSAGLVFLNGKVHTLPAVGSVDLGTVKYIRYLSNAGSDSRPLFGGGSSNTYETYLAEIANSAPMSGQFLEISQGAPAIRFSKEFLLPEVENFSTLIVDGVQFSAVQPLRVRKSLSGLVTLAGITKKLQNNGIDKITELPTGYAPANSKTFIVTKGATYGVGYILINTAGEVRALNTPALNEEWILDGISFYTDM